VRARFFEVGLSAAMAAYLGLLRALGHRRRPARDASGVDVLLTGTFHSENWVRAHLEPLVGANLCRRVRFVSLTPLPPIPGTEWVEPPRWLQRVVGGVPARLAVFLVLALRDRPHVVGGFHLLLNGLAAILAGRLSGAASLYFSVGGPEEMRDGGLWAENRLFSLIGSPSPRIERQLVAAACAADQIVTMGRGAARYFAARGAAHPPVVIAGAIDPTAYAGDSSPRDIDLLLVGRLVPVKRIDLFLDAVALLRPERSGLRAVVVGDGELREALRQRAAAQGLDGVVEWAGQQRDVRPYLRRARVFCLTSDSEGLALSLMEAAMCGVPAVVSHVGDLGDLVSEGVNGYLVAERSAKAFADRMLELLADEGRRARFAAAARDAAKAYETLAVSRLWDELLGRLTAAPAGRSSDPSPVLPERP
jgi:glycosyltransferase involved in cell wall biosynthesis